VRVRKQTDIFLSVTRGMAPLRLAIDIGSDPISGSVSNGRGVSKPFHGWIELTAVIEAARAAEEPFAALGESPDETLGSIPGAKGSEL
jgi:hypothetical protein